MIRINAKQICSLYVISWQLALVKFYEYGIMGPGLLGPFYNLVSFFFQVPSFGSPDDIHISYLPLAHVFERGNMVSDTKSLRYPWL